LALEQGVRLFTIGHSNRSADDLIALLSAHGIAHLVDVRRQPASRRLPHFNRPALAAALAAAGLGYTWLEALGGRRDPIARSPHTALQGALAGYADHMATPGFAAGVARLAEIAAAAAPADAAILCAEADPASCHRWLLSDHLVAHGWEVRHVRSRDTVTLHALSASLRVVDGRLFYDRGQRTLL